MYNYKHRKKKRCGQLKVERVEWPWPDGDQATAAVPSMSSTYRPIEDDSSPEYHSGEFTLFGTSEPEFLNILKCISAESARAGFQFNCYDIFYYRTLNYRNLDHFSGLLKLI
jgi:hypothetical protein